MTSVTTAICSHTRHWFRFCIGCLCVGAGSLKNTRRKTRSRCTPTVLLPMTEQVVVGKVGSKVVVGR
jgi:hypothetical protein